MQSYEDYLRSVLGYTDNLFYDDFQNDYYSKRDMYNVDYSTYYNDELEGLYPEIYRKISPYINSACNCRSGNISKDFIDNLVSDVCSKLEKDRILVNANSKDDRQVRQNLSLQDLIRILILNNLWNRPPFPPRPGPRPPFPPPGPGPRPPFPPPGPGPRPPFPPSGPGPRPPFPPPGPGPRPPFPPPGPGPREQR